MSEITTKPGDAFGALLQAYVGEGQACGTIERDDGHVAEHDAALYFSDPAEWGELERLACADATGAVLDVGAGAGRHALYLEAAGHPVTALDPSAGACAVARERGCRDVVHLPVERCGELDQVYDTVIMLGNNLALLGSPSAAGRILGQLAAAARPGATLWGISLDAVEGDPPPEHRGYHAHNRSRGRPAGQTTIRTHFRGLTDSWMDYWLMSPADLDDLLDGSAWELQGVRRDPPFYLAELRRI